MRYRKEIVMHGLSSLDKYLKHLEKLDRDFSPVINNFHEEISLLKNSIVATNNKAEWSVCRYVGKQKKVEDDLTKGQCYYWPSAINANFFRGIVDDEEYDSYLHKIYEADFFVKYDCASDNFFEHGKIYHVVGIINAGYNKGCYVIDFGDDGFGFQSATITDTAGFRKV